MFKWIQTSEQLASACGDEHDPNRLVIAQYGDGAMKMVNARAVCEEYHVAWWELPAPYVPPMRLILDRYGYLWKGPVMIRDKAHWLKFAGFTESGDDLWSVAGTVEPNDIVNREVKIAPQNL